MIAIIDYGVGNLFSLYSSFKAIGYEAVVTGDPGIIRKADKLILPGVGAFRDAAKKLHDSGLFELVKEQAVSGKPVMGICLGMQMLFERSYEYGLYEGLGLIPGEIRPIAEVIPANLKIPQIGWNGLLLSENRSQIFRDIRDKDCVYFVHSYQAVCDDRYIIARTEYGHELTAAVQRNNVFGCQFHPEKSGKVGLRILKAFCEMEDITC